MNKGKTVDLRTDEPDLRKLLVRQVQAQASAFAKDGSLPKVSAVEVVYQWDQGGWFFVHFDTRLQHDRDMTCLRFMDQKPLNRGLLRRRHWGRAAWAEGNVSFILPDGKKWVRPENCSAKKHAAMIGDFIKGVLKRARNDGIFDPLPRLEKCQLDILDFEGNWGWPKYEQLGKTNLL